MKKGKPVGDAVGCYTKKLLLFMKLTTLIILFACLQVSAKGFTQNKITLKLKAANFKNALEQIEKKAGVRFLYNDALFNEDQKVDVNANNQYLTEVLNDLFAGTTVKYKLMEDNLVVLSGGLGDFKADIKITGTVVDSSGAGLSSVSVAVKGTKNGTSTDAGGNFSITASDNATLVFSSLGYAMQEVAVNGRSIVNVTLLGSSQTLEQVVVVGYGTQRKIDVTGAVTSLKGEEISKQASINPISALQGKVAGVQITNAGSPGASPQIRIRGVGTVYGNPNPLYVVDGVWFDDISFLNSADIDNISILKDASSESIYGIRAANGVVLITTKKGRSGQAVVNYNAYAGWQKVTNQVQMANANEYATLVSEKYALLGLAPILDATKFTEGTNWYNQVLRNAFTMNHQVSISGGGDKSTYNFSVGYLKQEGIIKNNDYDRVTVRLQNDFQITKNFKMGYTAIAAAGKSNDINGQIFHQLYAAAPVVPVHYADGTYGDPADFNLGDGANFNPQATLDFYNQKSKNNRATGNAYADLKFANHFTLHSSLGGEYGENEVRTYSPVYKATLAQRRELSRLAISRAENRNWILENTLTYDNTFGDHKLRLLAGQAAQQYKSYGVSGFADNVPFTREGDLYLSLGNAAGRTITDYGDMSTVASYFGRANYSFQNKYLLTASLRADGSSKFSGDQRWGYFPSVGLGWVISQEKFMQTQSVFNTLKLRASWGKIGNASVPSNISTLVVNQGAFLTAIFNGQANTGASITSVVPPTTFWERGVGTDIGLEASMLHNKLTVDADYYIKKTEKAIFAIPILSSVGTTSSTIIGNQADFENRGFELAVNWKDNPNKNFSYSIGGNMGYNTNKVLAVSTGANPIFDGGGGATGGAYTTRTVLGQPIGQFFGRQVIGVFQSAAEVAAYKSSKGITIQPSAQNGDFKYADINDDGQIDDKDRVVLGNPNPKFSYGINTNFTYKNFDLTLDFQGVAGVDIYNANSAIRFGNENYTKDFFDNRWHGAGTSNTYSNPNVGGSTNYLPNSSFVESGSYFRVRNMQLGYTLPNNMLGRYGIKKLRVFANAQNAFNFFKYKGFSPEVGTTPGAKPTSTGIDTNVYPLYATYNFGLNLTF